MNEIATDAAYVMAYEHGIEYVEHLDGIDWFKAAPPPPEHAHVAQSRGIMAGHYIERCACGAARESRHGPWFFIGRDEPRVGEPRVGEAAPVGEAARQKRARWWKRRAS